MSAMTIVKSWAAALAEAPPILAPPREVAARTLAKPFALVLAMSALVLLVLRLAVSAVLPTWAVAVIAPAATLALVVAVFGAGVALGPLAVDERGEKRALTQRHGFWVVALGIVTGLPMLGAFSLVDPWETHYAEVAREMIERRDFVSPWWANEGWFMSKPVLVFWLESLSMMILGVRSGPDQVLAGAHSFASGAAHPEWAVRMPAFVLAVVGAYILYNGVSRTCSRRAGFAGAAILLTMPGYALLSHQAITDMPLVAAVAASLGFLLRALETPAEAHVSRWSIRLGKRAVTVHAGHAMALALLVLTVPQLLVLLSGHIHVDASAATRFAIPGGVHFGADRLFAGSPNACTLPGQPACAPVAVAHVRLPPFLQVAIWTPLVVWLTAQLANETRASRLFAIAAWTAAALGAMAKGPAALVVPAAAALAALAARRSLRPLLRLELLTGLGVVVVLVAPWYLAVFARHGRVFIDELVMRHMLGRTLEHLHDTNGTDDVGIAYFIKQLGYATFPWSGIALVAALAAPGHDDASSGSRRSRARALLFGATLFAFALVSSMGTKFHHYGLLVLPGAAMVAGMWLDERIAEAASDRGSGRAAASSAAFAAAALVVLLVARDLVLAPSDGHGPAGTARFLQLMTYRYDRRWPSTEVFAPALGAVAITAAIACIALALRQWRARAALALGACATLGSMLLLDGSLVRAASDGGQRGVFEAYYRSRDDDVAHGTRAAALVAYQLNWKGENFYTGNRVAIFISSGAPMRTYLDARKKSGEGTVYFVTERGRVAGLRNELGEVRSFAELTDRDVSYEFALVRAEL
jgi:4-amino-4-deoxy-L-arabinose transferase-like glycosyltransferase